MSNPISQPAGAVDPTFAPAPSSIILGVPSLASRCRCRKPHAGHEPKNLVTSTNKMSLVEHPSDGSITTILQPPTSMTTSTPPNTQPAPLSDTPRKQSSANEPTGTPQKSRKEKVGVEIKALREELCSHCFLSSFAPKFDDGAYDETVDSLPLLKADKFKLTSPSPTSSSRETWPVDSDEKAYYSPFTSLLNEIVDHFKEILTPHHSKTVRFITYDQPMAPITLKSLKPDLLLVEEKFVDLNPLQWKHPILPIEVKSDFWDALKQIGTYVREMLSARPGRQICWALYFNHLESASRVILFTPDRVHYTQPMVITGPAGYRDMVKVVIALLSQPNLPTIGEDRSRDSLTKLLPNGNRLEIQGTEFDRKSVVGRRTRVLSVMVVGKDGRGVGEKIFEHGECPANARTSSRSIKSPRSLNRVVFIPAVKIRLVISSSPATPPTPFRPPGTSASIPSPKMQASASSSRRPTTRSSTVSPTSASSSAATTPPSRRPATRSAATSPNQSHDDSHITSSGQLTLEESTAIVAVDYILEEIQKNTDEDIEFAKTGARLQNGEHLVIKESWPLLSRRDIEWDALKSCPGEFGVPEVVYRVTGKHPMPVECTPEPRVPQHIAFREKGLPLQESASPRDLLTAVLHAVIGHWNFFQKGWLHRDVSVGNVLMLSQPVMKSPPTGLDWIQGQCRGMLIDGDAMISSDPDRKPGDHRSCTLPFLSRRLVRAWGLGIKTFDQYFDDLESFAWVLLWVLLEIAEFNNRATPLDKKFMVHLTGNDLDALSAGKVYIIDELRALSRDIAQNSPERAPTSLSDPFITILDHWLSLIKEKDRCGNARTLPSSEESTLFYKTFITFAMERMNELPEVWHF